MIGGRPIGNTKKSVMNERPPEGSAPETPADQDDDQSPRTLTDLLDELDRAAFRRALACRDDAY